MKVEIVKDGRIVRLLEPLQFELNGEMMEIPVGFLTDFATSPRIVWSWIPPWGNYNKAAVVHDYLCRNKIVSRKEADDIFLNDMKQANVEFVKRNVMYAASRLYSLSLKYGILKESKSISSI